MADELERPGETPEHEEAEAHFPSSTIWPFAFAGAVALILLGLIVNMWLTVIGVDPRRRLRLPLDPPGHPGCPGRARARRGAGAGRRGGGRGGRGPCGVPALEVSRGGHTRPRRRHRRARDAARARLRRRACVRRPGVPVGRPRARSTTTRRATGRSPRSLEPDGREGEQAHRVHPLQRPEGRRSPSFSILSNRCVHLGCPTQPRGRPASHAGVETSAGRSSSRRTAAVRLRLPVPRRRLRRRGQQDRRPAGPRARPLRVLDHRREPLARGALQRRRSRRHRAPTR